MAADADQPISSPESPQTETGNISGGEGSASPKPGERDLASQPLEWPPLDLGDLKEYMGGRVLTWTCAGGVSGAATAFYRGEKMPLAFYNRALLGCVLSTTFFSASYMCRYVRQRDDAYNHVFSGVLNGAALGSLRGARRGVLSAAGGGVAGAVFYAASVWLYDTSRAAWINGRRQAMQSASERTLHVRKPKPPVNVPRETFVLFGPRHSEDKHRDSSFGTPMGSSGRINNPVQREEGRNRSNNSGGVHHAGAGGGGSGSDGGSGNSDQQRVRENQSSEVTAADAAAAAAAAAPSKVPAASSWWGSWW